MTKKPRAAAAIGGTDGLASAGAISAIVAGTHGDPFAVLGVQQAGKGFVARSFIPHAQEVTAHTLDGRPVGELSRRDDAGFFEGKLSIRKRQPLRYHARNAGGDWWLTDPYTFGPVLGPILTLAGGRDTVADGAALLAAYSAGLGIPFIVAEINRFGLESMGASERHVREFMSDLGYETYLFQPGQSYLQRLLPDESPETNYVFNVLFRHPEAPAMAA